MEYRNLGKTGTKVSPFALGMMTYGTKAWREWSLTEDEAKPFVKRAIEAGINFFDTADVYSLGDSERITGALLREFAVSREQVVVATKVFNPMSADINDRGLSRKHILKSIDKSLKALNTDYVDLYQIHRFDASTPIEETCEALDAVVRAGKALYIGASSMYAWQFQKMVNYQRSNGLAQFVTMQNYYNLAYREEEREMNPYCADAGIGLLPWSPLARGLLTGTRTRGDLRSGSTRARTDEFSPKLYNEEVDFDVVDRVVEVANARGAKPAQVALAWLLARPGVTAPIVGASKLYQLEDAIGALDLKLTGDEMKRLEEPYKPHPVLGITF